ncbi:MAG TPA: peptidoglycan-binding domain-containing protein [Terracidiphilus sp.]|jgi:peptidoglycan hydrolase-like protein with peptidoglycan-binding domain|nr:peptidoglycan-binding domain-containing protein [Terracidiphilus sp.]
MLSFRASLGLLLSSALFAVPAVAARVHKVSASTTRSHTSSNAHLTKGRISRKGHKATMRGRKVRGQQAIESSRATEIQQALIREHYMSGEASGQWDPTTQAAMRKYQSDQGWQTKLMPDSRALKKLGLGADYSSAINAKTASFSDPPSITSIPSPQAAGFASAAGTDR